MKVLISDKIYEKALEILREKRIEYAYEPEVNPADLLFKIPQYEALIVRSRTKVTREVIEAGGNLSLIGRVGSGVDNIDMEAVRENEITVVNAPSANAPSVAEHTVALILNLLRSIPRAIFSMGEGQWLKKELTGSELGGKTVGIVGYGNVGKRVETLIKAFGAKVLIYSRSTKNCTLSQIFQESDIITLHVALTSETRGMVNAVLLSYMKPESFLINVSRGEIVAQEALYNVLSGHKIAGAALDVFWQEPLPSDSRWRKLDNVIATPHIGAATREALERASLTVVADIVAVLTGKEPKNKV